MENAARMLCNVLSAAVYYYSIFNIHLNVPTDTICLPIHVGVYDSQMRLVSIRPTE